MVCLCVFSSVCICSDSLPVVGVDVWPQPGEGAPLQDKFAAVIYVQMSVCRVYRPVSVSLSIAENHAWICQCLLSWWKTLTSRWKHASPARCAPGSTVPATRSSSAEIRPHLFPQNSIKASSTTVQRFHVPHRKKPNVCLLSLVFTSSLPPLSQSSAPVLAVLLAEPARSALHAAVQRQPQRLQPHQLPRLLSWSVLPAADRPDQRDGQPRGQRPLAVCCQGPRVLHSGPKGKDVISLKTSVFKCVQKMLFLIIFFCFCFSWPQNACFKLHS